MKLSPNSLSFHFHLSSSLSLPLRNPNSPTPAIRRVEDQPQLLHQPYISYLDFSYTQMFIHIDLRQVPYAGQLIMHVFFLLMLQSQFNCVIICLDLSFELVFWVFGHLMDEFSHLEDQWPSLIMDGWL